MNSILPTIIYCVVGCNAGSPDKQTLHLLECDTNTGSMALVQTVKGIQGTNYFCIDKKSENVYTYIAEEVNGKKRGVVVKFPIVDGRIGEMVRLAQLPSEPPCYISLSPDESRIGFACYGSATVGTLSVDGSKLAIAVHDNQNLGTDEKRQDKAHAHCAIFSPDGKTVGMVDLGKDCILFYDSETMKPVPSMTVHADPGDGPRHAVWSKDGKFLFVVNELGNSVMSFSFDGKKFNRIGKWSSLPEGFAEWSKAAAIKLNSDGTVLLASNRGYDKNNSIAVFEVNKETGELKLRNVAQINGVFPRDFEFLPGEKFVIVGHKRSDEVLMYRFDKKDFSLKPLSGSIKIWKPLCFKFL